MSSTRKFQGRVRMFRTAVLGFMVLCVSAPALLSQYREIPLPYRDTTRVKVQFLDSLHGWVVNYRGTILRTTDGGVQWTEHHFTADSTIDDLEFVDKRNGWLLFSKAGPGDNFSAHRLYTTSDAGGSWVKVPIFPDTMRPTERPNGRYWRTPFSRIVPARNIEFVDSNTVYMESASRKSIMFWRTTNRGQTWEELRNAPFDATPFNQTVHHLEVLDSLHWFIVHTYPIIHEMAQPAFVTTTSDGGETWVMTGYWDDEIIFNVCQSGPLVYTISPRAQREVLPGYALAKYTTDGGYTWHIHNWLGEMRMGYLLSDTSIWGIRDATFFNEYDGPLRRNSLTGLPTQKYPHPIRWLSKAGEHLFALTADGKLIVFDSRLVGVEQPQDTEKSFQNLAVYPNPAREQVSVVYSAAAPAELVISDLHGRILHRQSTNPAQSGASTTSTISLRTYPPGVYHVQLTTATTRRSTLFLVY